MYPHLHTLGLLSLSDDDLGSTLVSPIAGRRGKEEAADYTWPGDLEVMLGKILRTYWRWICARKKQTQSHRPVNGCHYLHDCCWRNSSKSGNSFCIISNIISARKAIVLLSFGSPQMQLQGDARGFSLDLRSSSATYEWKGLHVKVLNVEGKVYSIYIWTDCDTFDPFPLHFSVYQSIIWADFYAIMLTAVSQTMKKSQILC